MKKYKKPELYIERFELSRHIAGCNLELNMLDVYSCTASGTIEVNGMNLPIVTGFVEGNNACEATIDDSYCITNSTFQLTTINS